MLNLSDNELDKLSREAAEKFEPAENAQSWNKLEQLLDKNLGKPSPVPKTIKPGMPFIYSGAILIAITSIYFLTKSKKDTNNSTLKNSAVTNQKQANKNLQQDSNAVAFLDKKQETIDKLQETTDKEQAKQVGGNKIVNKETSERKQEAGDNLKEARDKGQGKQISGNEIVNKETSGKKQEAGNNLQNVSVKGQGKPVGRNEIVHKETSNKKQEAEDNLQDATNKGQGKQISGNEIVSKETSGKKQGQQVGGNKDNKIVVEKSANKNPAKDNLLSSNSAAQYDYASAENKHHNRNSNDDKKIKNNIDPFKGNADESNSSETNQQDENLKFASAPGIASAGGAFEGLNDSALRNFNPTQLSNTIITKKYNRTAFVNRSLQFGFIFAPEFSKVKYIYDNNRVGNSFGISLSYQLFSKISVNSGVIFSKKYYQAGEKQFHAPPNAAGNNFDIEFVNASANVIDIPINIRYNYFSDGNSTFFINGGFSSYIMQKENFDYYCHYSNGGFQYQGWVRPQQAPSLQKNYLFSIVNLSAGFETSISNSFSFQFEPYMKLPLKGIGFGKVDLSSYGISMSLKYAPVLKRGRR